MKNAGRPLRQLLIAPVVAGAISLLCGSNASAAVYSDSTGEQAGGPEVDISSVVVTNDATNLYFQINLTGNINSSGVNDFGNYLIGIDSMSGGTTTAGDPWGHPIGIASGMDDWVGTWVNFGGGSELHHWTGAAWGGTDAGTAVALAANGLTVTVPLSKVGAGLVSGSVVNFDVWSTFGSPGGQSAYDALSASGLAVSEPWNGNAYLASSTPSYTVVVPEPATIGSIAAVALGSMTRRRREA